MGLDKAVWKLTRATDLWVLREGLTPKPSTTALMERAQELVEAPTGKQLDYLFSLFKKVPKPMWVPILQGLKIPIPPDGYSFSLVGDDYLADVNWMSHHGVPKPFGYVIAKLGKMRLKQLFDELKMLSPASPAALDFALTLVHERKPAGVIKALSNIGLNVTDAKTVTIADLQKVPAPKISALIDDLKLLHVDDALINAPPNPAWLTPEIIAADPMSEKRRDMIIKLLLKKGPGNPPEVAKIIHSFNIPYPGETKLPPDFSTTGIKLQGHISNPAARLLIHKLKRVKDIYKESEKYKTQKRARYAAEAAYQALKRDAEKTAEVLASFGVPSAPNDIQALTVLILQHVLSEDDVDKLSSALNGIKAKAAPAAPPKPDTPAVPKVKLSYFELAIKIVDSFKLDPEAVKKALLPYGTYIDDKTSPQDLETDLKKQLPEKHAPALKAAIDDVLAKHPLSPADAYAQGFTLWGATDIWDEEAEKAGGKTMDAIIELLSPKAFTHKDEIDAVLHKFGLTGSSTDAWGADHTTIMADFVQHVNPADSGLIWKALKSVIEPEGAAPASPAQLATIVAFAKHYGTWLDTYLKKAGLPGADKIGGPEDLTDVSATAAADLIHVFKATQDALPATREAIVKQLQLKGGASNLEVLKAIVDLKLADAPTEYELEKGTSEAAAIASVKTAAKLPAFKGDVGDQLLARLEALPAEGEQAAGIFIKHVLAQTIANRGGSGNPAVVKVLKSFGMPPAQKLNTKDDFPSMSLVKAQELLSALKAIPVPNEAPAASYGTAPEKEKDPLDKKHGGSSANQLANYILYHYSINPAATKQALKDFGHHMGDAPMDKSLPTYVLNHLPPSEFDKLHVVLSKVKPLLIYQTFGGIWSALDLAAQIKNGMALHPAETKKALQDFGHGMGDAPLDDTLADYIIANVPNTQSALYNLGMALQKAQVSPSKIKAGKYNAQELAKLAADKNKVNPVETNKVLWFDFAIPLTPDNPNLAIHITDKVPKDKWDELGDAIKAIPDTYTPPDEPGTPTPAGEPEAAAGDVSEPEPEEPEPSPQEVWDEEAQKLTGGWPSGTIASMAKGKAQHNPEAVQAILQSYGITVPVSTATADQIAGEIVGLVPAAKAPELWTKVVNVMKAASAASSNIDTWNGLATSAGGKKALAIFTTASHASMVDNAKTTATLQSFGVTVKAAGHAKTQFLDDLVTNVSPSKSAELWYLLQAIAQGPPADDGGEEEGEDATEAWNASSKAEGGPTALELATTIKDAADLDKKKTQGLMVAFGMMAVYVLLSTAKLAERLVLKLDPKQAKDLLSKLQAISAPAAEPSAEAPKGAAAVAAALAKGDPIIFVTAVWDKEAEDAGGKSSEKIVKAAKGAASNNLGATKAVLQDFELGDSFHDEDDLIEKLVKNVDPADSEKLWKALEKVATGPSFAPLMHYQQQELYALITKKGGAKNPKVVKVLAKYAIPLTVASADDIPAGSTGLSQEEYKAAAAALKKLKVMKATKKQVGDVLSLLMAIDPAAWKKSDLSKEWKPKDLRASELMKRSSIELQDLAKRIKTEFPAKKKK